MPVPGKNPAEPDFQDDLGLTTGMLTVKGVETPRGAPANTWGQPPYRIGEPGQTNWLLVIGGGTQTKYIPGSAGITFRNNADTQDNFIIDGSGNIFNSGVQYSNTLSSATTFGGANSLGSQAFLTSGIVSGTPSRCARIYIPNNTVSFVCTVTFRAANTGTNFYHSTRVGSYNIAISRIAGAAAVGGIATASGTQIATSGSATLTCTLTLNTVSGTTSALNTIDVFANITTSDTNTAEIALYVESLNGQANGSVITA